MEGLVVLCLFDTGGRQSSKAVFLEPARKVDRSPAPRDLPILASDQEPLLDLSADFGAVSQADLLQRFKDPGSNFEPLQAGELHGTSPELYGIAPGAFEDGRRRVVLLRIPP